MRDIYFHEDDYLQVEILDRRNYTSCMEEIKNIYNFHDGSKKDTSSGYEEIYVRKPINIPTKDLNLDISKFIISLEDRGIKKYDNISNHIFNKYDLGKDKSAVAYGNTPYVTILIDYFIKDNIIDNISLIINETEANYNQIELMKTLNTIKSISDFILVDWSLLTVFRLSDDLLLEKYLNDLYNLSLEIYSEDLTDFYYKKDD